MGGLHVRGKTGGCRPSSAISGCAAWSLGGVRAAEQGAALPGRPTDGRGDHPRHATSRAGDIADRTRGLIAILWRAGLRISEALALTETDLDPETGSVLVRAGKGGKRRMVGMDDWGWEHVARWAEHRIQLPVGPLFCILAGPTRGPTWSATAARGELRRLAAQGACVGGSRRTSYDTRTRLRWHEGIPLPIIQRQLGHAHLGITSIYLQGIDTREIVETVHHRRPPVIPASAGRGHSATPERGLVLGATSLPAIATSMSTTTPRLPERYPCCPQSAAR
jgi:integrase-like protein